MVDAPLHGEGMKEPMLKLDEEEPLSTLVFFNLKFIMSASDRKRFWYKVGFVFVLTYALLPLMAEKSVMPKLMFTVFLVVLHLFIIVVYFWRVKVRQLDPDWRCIVGRIFALAFTITLLMYAAKMEDGTPWTVLAFEFLILCTIHAVVLALLTIRVRYATPEEQRDNCCTPRCCAVSCRKFLFVLVILAAVAVLSWWITKSLLQSGTDIAPPAAACAGNNTIAYHVPYVGARGWSGVATFEYAMTFVPTDVMVRADKSTLTTGNMFICFQTTGMQKSGPGNCTNSFAYDDSTCTLAVSLSECQSQVQHLHTDVEINWISYLSETNTIKMMTSSPHLVGWGRDIELTKKENPIVCPKADSTGPKFSSLKYSAEDIRR